MIYLERVTIVFNADGSTKTIEGIDLEKREGFKDVQGDPRTVKETDKDFVAFLERVNLQAMADRDAAKADLEAARIENATAIVVAVDAAKAEAESNYQEAAERFEALRAEKVAAEATAAEELAAERARLTALLATAQAEALDRGTTIAERDKQIGELEAEIAACRSAIAISNSVIHENTIRIATDAETLKGHAAKVIELELKIADDETVIRGLAETQERLTTELGEKSLELEASKAELEALKNPPVNVRHVSKTDFLFGLMTQAERVAVKTSKEPAVLDCEIMLNSVSYVDLDDSRLPSMLGALVHYGCLTAERSAAILKGERVG